MKIGLASDLHLDFSDVNSEFFDWRGDVLCIAGDTCEDDNFRKVAVDFFDRVSKMAKYVIVITGNHEYYSSELDAADGHIEKFLEQWPNIIFLQNKSVTLDGVEFFGSTMWTDFGNNAVAEQVARQTLNDYRHIRVVKKGYSKIVPRDILVEHMQAKNSLIDFLAAPGKGPRVVITHHAPTYLSTHPQYANERYLNLAYHSDLSNLILDNPSIHHWFHGHTHYYFHYNVGRTEVHCNPRGYPGERPAHLPAYVPKDIIIEV